MSQKQRLSAGELDGLPQHLIDQIGLVNTGGQDVLQALRDLGGTAHIDRVLVQLWKNTGKVKTKNAVQQVLGRLRSQGLVERVASCVFAEVSDGSH
jgi:hypothetical protein